MLSMTGYGKAEYTKDGLTLTVEMKTVNNRNFDFNCKTPRAFMAYEDLIRKTVQSYVKRGRVDLFLTYTDTREHEVDLTVDLDKANGYYFASKQIAEKFNLDNDCTVSFLMKCPDVITDNAVSDLSGLEDIIAQTVQGACEKLNQMRKVEGEKLVADMLLRMSTIKDLADKISVRAPLVASEYRSKLSERMQEILGDVKYDEARLLSEVAFFTDRANIDEELTRLNSHIAQFIEISKVDGAGKKLDFLMQEFNRETNTICSKSNDIEVTSLALSLKNEIEKVREQVQNIE